MCGCILFLFVSIVVVLYVLIMLFIGRMQQIREMMNL
jgi:hypothetical protein